VRVKVDRKKKVVVEKARSPLFPLYFSLMERHSC